MEKIYGATERHDCIDQTGREKWILFYGFGKDDETSERGWEYRHTFTRKPSLSEVKQLILDTINAATEEKIERDFEWNGQSIWLSKENQLNFTAIRRSESVEYPLRLKVNETTEGNAVYMTFEDRTAFAKFSDAVTVHVLQIWQEGWKEKDNIDWDKFKT